MRRKKWIVAVFVLILLGAAVYLLAVRERTFQSYANVSVGMPIGTALDRLKSQGYLLLTDAPAVAEGCPATERYNLVWGPDPTYLITISPGNDCKVKEIKRKLRRVMEL